MLAVPWPLLGTRANFDLVRSCQLIGPASAVEPGARIAFEFTGKQGGALITKYPTYREDAQRQLTFEDYTKKHYDSWVRLSRDQGHGRDIRPVLVTGVDLTREFATVAYTNNHARVECRFSAEVPAVASASASVWGSWHVGGLVRTNCGPRSVRPPRGDRGSSEGSTLESAIPPDEYNQCVFIRYYTIYKIFDVILKVIKAGAGPHQLPESDPEDGRTGGERLQVSSDDDSTDEVIHNVPSVCTERCPRLPLLTNWAKDDRDGFDIVAKFIFKVGNVLLCIGGTKEQTLRQRTGAKSVLLHHHDVQDLLQVCLRAHLDFSLTLVQEEEEQTIRVLAESGVAERVEIDENGGESLTVLA